MSRATGKPTNRLLESLPARDRTHVLARCERVQLAIPDVIDEAGDVVRHVYFPTTSFVSLIARIGSTATLEVSLAGNEGLYGLPVAMGVRVSPVQAIVQGSGEAWRMGAADFRKELDRTPTLRAAVNRYSYVVLSQLSQNAGCNRFHRVEQRLARWLLMTADRAHSKTFRITHEFLARMLGVRRVGITQAAVGLQKNGLITYKRGVITVLDPAGLERASCDCYRAELSIYQRVFS